MNRGLRLVAACALACASVPFTGVGSAHADTAVKAPTNSGYFNASGIDKPDASPAAPPNVTSEYADGVAPGHLGVSASGGQATKVSFLLFDVFDLGDTATVQKAVLRLPLVPSSPPEDIVYQEGPDKIAVCKAGDEGFAGDDGTGITKAPSQLCDAFSAKAVASKDGKAYEFDVTGLVTSWLTGANDGIAVTVAKGAEASSFQVVFDRAETATLTVDYTGGVVEEPVQVPVDTPVQAPPVDLGTGVVPPSGGFAPAPEVGGVVPEVAVPDVQAPEVPAPAAPSVAQPQAVPVAAVVPAPMRPTAVFWVTGAVLLVGLALLSLVLGDPQVAGVRRSRTRLSTALAASSRSGGVRPLTSRPV